MPAETIRNAPDHGIPFGDALRVWVRVALNSFGGPAGQIAVMHRILVEEKRWIDERRFLHALNYCMVLPGPEAQQLATYMGWLLHGTAGGLAAGILFILPGFLSILGLSIVYAVYSEATLVTALFFGLKASVLAVVLDAVVRIGKRALKNRTALLIAAAAFFAIFFLNVPFPFIVLGAGIVGLVGGSIAPRLFRPRDAAHGDAEFAVTDAAASGTKPTLAGTARTAALWLAVWWLPFAAIILASGADSVFSRLAVFFSEAAMVTFGGAYAVLAYIAQQAVEVYGWLAPGEMLDGLGMAETTPGPLIQVVQFVGFMAAYREPLPFQPLTAGIVGAAITTWATFAPCFLWIFLGAPYMEGLREKEWLSDALSAITAAVVGVILNLAVWFGLNVLFGTVHELRAWGLRLIVPDLSSIDPAAAAIGAAALVALFKLKLGMIPTLLGGAAAGMLLRIAFS